ncbi:MAG: DUF1232 domain-containing protein [Ardenticatenales bacterium]|nr:DUF1232 domain-containing protein [Ardenticatenales bacterium]
MNLPTKLPSRDVLAQQAKEPGFWKELWNQIRLIGYLVKDPQVPIYLKLLPVAAIAYVLVPLDLLPDFMVGLGQVDDLTALFVASKVFVDLSPQHIVAHYRERLRQEFQGEKGVKMAEDDVSKTIIIDAEDFSDEA